MPRSQLSVITVLMLLQKTTSRTTKAGLSNLKRSSQCHFRHPESWGDSRPWKVYVLSWQKGMLNMGHCQRHKLSVVRQHNSTPDVQCSMRITAQKVMTACCFCYPPDPWRPALMERLCQALPEDRQSVVLVAREPCNEGQMSGNGQRDSETERQ